MILSNLKDEWIQQRAGSWRRVGMEIRWEDCDLPPRQLYFEAEGATAELFRPNRDGFAIASLPLAIWHGERRLRVEGSLCTRLRTGLPAINQVFHEWYPDTSLVQFEPSGGFAPTRPAAEPATAALLSGGVDGLTCLRRNRLEYPPDHPHSIRACITLFGVSGFDFDGVEPAPERLAAFEQLLGRLRPLADAEHFDLHPVITNIRSLAPSYRFWTCMGFGAAHVAVGQLFQGSFDRLLLASDGDGLDPLPGATHPRCNHHFSTDSVQVIGTEDEMTRADKLRILIGWPQATRLMQPCHQTKAPTADKFNCGRCEKCLRTMLALLSMGQLAAVSAFTENDVNPVRLLLVSIHNEFKAKMLAMSTGDLRRIGRHDLVWAIKARLFVYRLLGG